ncbi:hypothetical protein RB653_002640 [Dictyostelium firmibasis]|uniref:Uncharacterized protein n=1 Tax=Dictyostelium firmibasis TaxID=79012 RepID=A0AAN7U3A6_9MYCE
MSILKSITKIGSIKNNSKNEIASSSLQAVNYGGEKAQFNVLGSLLGSLVGVASGVLVGGIEGGVKGLILGGELIGTLSLF